MNKLSLSFISLCIIILLFIITFNGFTSSEKNNNSKKKWELVFEDNFDSFNSSNWITLHDNGNRTIWSNKELQWYKDKNVVVENGICKLIAKKESIYGKDVESEKQFGYTSGMICSSKGFLQQYGKWEMKVKFPFNKGCWPAFYLVPLKRPTLPEIDIFEYFGKKENEISCTIHYGTDYYNPNRDNTVNPYYYNKTKDIIGDFSDRWMIWSLECTPDKIVWKLDGKTILTSDSGIPTEPLYMIANLAVKDFDEPVDDSGIPYVMEIDYVKCYKWVSE
jgi:beta-glucanase (GH16 family)